MHACGSLHNFRRQILAAQGVDDSTSKLDNASNQAYKYPCCHLNSPAVWNYSLDMSREENACSIFDNPLQVHS